MLKKEKSKSTKEIGITLIALVITIIVLLILVGVTIATLTGDNGILTRANDARERTAEANAREQVQIAVQGSYDETGKINMDDLNTELSRIDDLTSGTPISSLPATVVVDGYEILIGANGSVGEVIRMEEYQTAETKPYLPNNSFTQVEGTSLENGLVVTDGTNYWTWIEVPRSIYTTAQSATDYEAIENDMETYTGELLSRNNFIDVWYDRYGVGYDEENEYSQISFLYPQENNFNAAKELYGAIYTDANGQTEATNYASGTTYYVKITDNLSDTGGCGLTYEGYNNLKKYMLSSVYTNGGFWIGQYEAGSSVVRTSGNQELTIPVIQQDAYPYNWINCSDAQIKSSEVNSGNYTSSLLFGIQWDLVLKHLQTHGTTLEELTSNSTEWGNYRNAKFDIKRGQYFENGGTNYTPVNETYSKISLSRILLTTGATERNMKMNIYDLAGNVNEFTLEYEVSGDMSTNSVFRGGDYYSYNGGSSYPASYRSARSSDRRNDYYGFRPALY